MCDKGRHENRKNVSAKALRAASKSSIFNSRSGISKYYQRKQTAISQGSVLKKDNSSGRVVKGTLKNEAMKDAAREVGNEQRADVP